MTTRATGAQRFHRTVPDRCGRGHDLTDRLNVMIDATGAWRCRVCRNLSNKKFNDARTVRTKCIDCGCEKPPSKSRMCSPCRWKRATEKKDPPSPRGKALKKALDDAIELELGMPWEKKAAAARKEQERMERLRSKET